MVGPGYPRGRNTQRVECDSNWYLRLPQDKMTIQVVGKRLLTYTTINTEPWKVSAIGYDGVFPCIYLQIILLFYNPLYTLHDQDQRTQTYHQHGHQHFRTFTPPQRR
jgi:hypothetical protein